MEEVVSTGDLLRTPHRLKQQSLSNFGEPESVWTPNGDKQNCVFLQYVSRSRETPQGSRETGVKRAR